MLKAFEKRLETEDRWEKMLALPPNYGALTIDEFWSKIKLDSLPRYGSCIIVDPANLWKLNDKEKRA